MSRRKNNRKAKNVILSLMLIVAIGVTAAFAFLTASETSENLFTVGNVKIDLSEPKWDAANPDGILENIVSGQKIVKDPTITNTGKNNAYVYAMVEVPKADGIIIDDAIVNDYQLFNYTVNEGWELLNSKIDGNDENNYYLYAYHTTLEPSSTSTLFNEVVFANIASDFQPEEELNIKVTGYAIQSDYYNGEATDAASAWNVYATQNGWKFPTNPANSTGSGDTTNVDPVQVFSLNNLADNGHMESIFRNSPIITGNMDIATVSNSGGHSFVSMTSTVYRATKFDELSTGDYYVACKVKFINYVSGYAGITIDGGGNDNTIIASVSESTNDEFVTASGIATIFDTTPVSFMFGCTDTSSGRCYIDDIVFIPLSAFEFKPTKEELNIWYEEYLNNLEETYAAETLSANKNRKTFVVNMNEKAQKLGMENTAIYNPDGYGSDYSTARDAMKMMIAASKNNVIAEVWANTYSNSGANGTHTFSVKNGERIRSVTGKTTITNDPLLTDYKILGGKTGTGPETRCIGVIAEIDGQKVVAVIMGATSEANRYSAINDLLGIASNKIADSSYDVSTETVEDAPSAIAAIITDDGYEILYEQAADTRQNLASMTKVLNVLTALDYIEDPKTETLVLKYSEYGDNVYPYDEFTYEDAFYHMLLPSSNTTAKAVARSIGEKITNS